MEEKRISESFACGHIVYPLFLPDSDPAAARMSAFYRTLRDAVVQYAESLRTAGVSYQYTADYTSVCVPSGEIRITVTLRLRRRGRTVAQRLLAHSWKDGILVACR